MKYFINIFLLILTCSTSTLFASNTDSAQENPDTVMRWNDFVDKAYQLHLKQTDNRKIKTTARSGSYHNLPSFFQEIKFYDLNSDVLLSKVEWETKNPDKLHSIEVYVYGKNNQLVREYSASYLPKFRNAPYQTLINLHHHSDTIDSYRQFDASNNLIYEVCRSATNNEKIFEHDDYEIPDNYKQGIGANKQYQQCFRSLPWSAEAHLVPH